MYRFRFVIESSLAQEGVRGCERDDCQSWRVHGRVHVHGVSTKTQHRVCLDAEPLVKATMWGPRRLTVAAGPHILQSVSLTLLPLDDSSKILCTISHDAGIVNFGWISCTAADTDARTREPPAVATEALSIVFTVRTTPDDC